MDKITSKAASSTAWPRQSSSVGEPGALPEGHAINKPELDDSHEEFEVEFVPLVSRTISVDPQESERVGNAGSLPADLPEQPRQVHKKTVVAPAPVAVNKLSRLDLWRRAAQNEAAAYDEQHKQWSVKLPAPGAEFKTTYGVLVQIFKDMISSGEVANASGLVREAWRQRETSIKQTDPHNLEFFDFMVAVDTALGDEIGLVKRPELINLKKWTKARIDELTSADLQTRGKSARRSAHLVPSRFLIPRARSSWLGRRPRNYRASIGDKVKVKGAVLGPKVAKLKSFFGYRHGDVYLARY